MSLLDKDSPRLYRPRVAVALGSIIDAAVLEQIDYWLARSTKEWGGYRWVYKTRSELAKELGLKEHQVRRSLDRLRARDLLIAIENPHHRWDRTLWWRIDYHALDALVTDLAPEPEPPGTVPHQRAAAATRLDSEHRSIERESPKIGPQRPSNTKDYLQESTTKNTSITTTTTGQLPEPRQGSKDPSQDAFRRLEKFVDAKLKAGLGKAEYRDDDLAKPSWLEVFESLECADEEFDQALTAAMSRTDSDWLKRMRGPKSAQAFAGALSSLLPTRHPAYDLPSLLDAGQVAR